MRAPYLLTVSLCCLQVLAHASSVLYLDNKHNDYFKGSEQFKASIQELQGFVAALTGLRPGVDIDLATSKQISSVLKPSPWKKPQAHLSLSLCGVSNDDLSAIFAERQQIQATAQDDQHTADVATDLISALATANPDVQFQLLEDIVAKSCVGADCLDQLLPTLAQSIHGEYDSITQKLSLADGTELDLTQLDDKTFAMELLSVAAGIQKLMQQFSQHGEEDIAVVDLTVVGLQELARKYGQQSAETLAAKAALLSVLKSALHQLDAHFDGDVTLQVALSDESPVAEDAATSIADWKQQRHARFLQSVTQSSASWLGDDTQQAAYAKLFTTKAAGYGAFILLLYFLAAGAYCMCNMPFKKDSLLYGSKKD